MRRLVLRVATGMGMGVGICEASAVGAVDLPPPLEDADFRPLRLEEAQLGQLLFYDPLLSGNKEVAVKLRASVAVRVMVSIFRSKSGWVPPHPRSARKPHSGINGFENNLISSSCQFSGFVCVFRPCFDL